MKNIIPALASGAVRALLNKGITDPVVIQYEATLEVLAGFVRVMGGQPDWRQVEQIKKAIEQSIEFYTVSTIESPGEP